MTARKHELRVCLWTTFTLAAAVLSAAALGQGSERPHFGQAEVIGNDVYVRSGDSINHYPVCKLNAGIRVTIVGERGEWYEILPPEGAFSLISAEYVDSVDNVRGVVNGNNVRVRAGSDVKAFENRRDQVQTKLSKGAEVSIIGANPDGFLRIVPPDGATMWIARELVQLVPDALVETERELGETPDAKTRPPQESAEGPAGAEGKSSPGAAEPKSPLAAQPSTPQRQQLDDLDDETRAELSKPLLERELGPVIERYQEIAGQEEDVLARRYARRRVNQIAQMVKMIEAVRRVRKLDEEAETVRREYLEKRLHMPSVVPPEPGGVDAQGELRASALYPPGSHPRRYRLVDTTGEVERTIGYVEIPRDSGIEPEAYLGRYVGVRAAKTRLQVGGVNPVPIYIASELVLLQPAQSKAGSPPQSE